MDKGLNRRFNLLTLLNLVILVFVLLISFNNPTPLQSNTYITAKPDNGKSAYELAQAGGFKGSLEEYQASLRGANSESVVERTTILKDLPTNGKDAVPCEVSSNEDGSFLLKCANTSVVIPKPIDGTNGENGDTVLFRTNQG